MTNKLRETILIYFFSLSLMSGIGIGMPPKFIHCLLKPMPHLGGWLKID